MKALKWMFLAAAVLLLPASVTADEEGGGGGPVEGRVENLRLGTYWYGPQITHDDLIGKVVLVELWGS